MTGFAKPLPLSLHRRLRLRLAIELAGGCFSPDGKWFFVKSYSPTTTFAITGPWRG